MKRFIVNLSIFCGLVLVLIVAGALLPATPRANQSILSTYVFKHGLLKESPSPRLIFVGGSGGFSGIESPLVKETTKYNPINMSLLGDLGIFYMLDSVKSEIRAGDVVVLIPEYFLFFGDTSVGREPLLRLALDIFPESRQSLPWQQWSVILQCFPRYALSKLDPREYYDYGRFFSMTTINDYGDNIFQNGLPRKAFAVLPADDTTSDYNQAVMAKIISFSQEIEAKGAKLIVSWPAIQDKSYDNIEPIINFIEQKFLASGLTVVGLPRDYRFADNLMFDSPYHVSAEGRQMRTNRLLEDLAPYLAK